MTEIHEPPKRKPGAHRAKRRRAPDTPALNPRPVRAWLAAVMRLAGLPPRSTEQRGPGAAE